MLALPCGEVNGAQEEEDDTLTRMCLWTGGVKGAQKDTDVESDIKGSEAETTMYVQPL